jgi:hypothetical protein
MMGAGVLAGGEGALVSSPGFAPPPALAWPSPLTWAAGVGKATDRIFFFQPESLCCLTIYA